MALTFEHWNPETAERFKQFDPKKGIDGFLGIRIDDVEPVSYTHLTLPTKA